MPDIDSVSTASYFHCFTTHSVTVDLTTHASAPKVVFETGRSRTRDKGCRALQVLTAGTGTVAVSRGDGIQETITSIPSNTYLPIRAKKLLPGGNFTSIIVYW